MPARPRARSVQRSAFCSRAAQPTQPKLAAASRPAVYRSNRRLLRSSPTVTIPTSSHPSKTEPVTPRGTDPHTLPPQAPARAYRSPGLCLRARDKGGKLGLQPQPGPVRALSLKNLPFFECFQYGISPYALNITLLFSHSNSLKCMCRVFTRACDPMALRECLPALSTEPSPSA